MDAFAGHAEILMTLAAAYPAPNAPDQAQLSYMAITLWSARHGIYVRLYHSPVHAMLESPSSPACSH